MKINEKLQKLIALLIGGTAVTLSGVNLSIGIAAWIAPIFLLHYTRNSRPVHFIFLFIVLSAAGMISQTGLNLYHLPAVTVVNGINFGILNSVMYIIDRLLYRKGKNFYYSFIFPSAVILVEYMGSSAIGTWGLIVHTQYEIKPLLQFCSIAGIYGVSFIVAWFSAVVIRFTEQQDDSKASCKEICIYGSIFLAVLLFGELRMTLLYPDKETVKTAAVTSDLDVTEFAAREQDALKILSEDYSAPVPARMFSDSSAVNTMLDRTIAAAAGGAKIIVWNEIALIIDRNQKEQLTESLQSVCKAYNVYVLAAFLEECSEAGKKPFNNKSILLSPDGEIVWEYMKSYLHPVAEVPIINGGDFKIPVAETEFGRIGNVICYDLDMNSYIMQAGKNSVDILLVPASDWREITPLHSHMACPVAVEYGCSIVRSNGKGLSVAYDYMGNIKGSGNTFTDRSKITFADVPVGSVTTVYSLLGDVIVYLALLFLLFISVMMFVKRKK